MAELLPKLSEDEARDLIEHAKDETAATFDQLADRTLTGVDAAKSIVSVVLAAVTAYVPGTVDDSMVAILRPMIMTSLDQLEDKTADPDQLRARAKRKLRDAAQHEVDVAAWESDGKKQLFEKARIRAKTERIAELRAEAAHLEAEATLIEAG